MADLHIQKSGFDQCIAQLDDLASNLVGMSIRFDHAPEDTSLMGAKERECFEKLVEIIDDLTCLAEETKKDVKLTKARYVLADK